MKTYERPAYPPASHPVLEEKHVLDYLRVVYRRRWIALPVFLVLFVIGAVNALRQTPVYQAHAQLLIQKDSPTVARLDQIFEAQDTWSESDFYQTQFRMLQSRTLARRTIDAMKLWNVPRLGNGPIPKAEISLTGFFWQGVGYVVGYAKKAFAEPPPPQPADVAE